MTTFDYAARIERARREMRARGVDVLLASLGSELPYLTGYQAIDHNNQLWLDEQDCAREAIKQGIAGSGTVSLTSFSWPIVLT